MRAALHRPSPEELGFRQAPLCDAARAKGIARLCDRIVPDGPGLGPYLRRGFDGVGRTDGAVIVRKELTQ